MASMVQTPLCESDLGVETPMSFALSTSVHGVGSIYLDSVTIPC